MKLLGNLLLKARGVRFEPGTFHFESDYSNHATCITKKSRRMHNVGLTLVHRLRRWPNVEPALGERFFFPGNDCHRPLGAGVLNTPNHLTMESGRK